MPQDPSRPSSWKGEDRSALPGGRRPGQGTKYSWKAGTPSSGPPSGRKIKAGFYSFLGILVVIGLVVLILYLQPQREICVVVVASDPRQFADDLSLPLNIYGHRDARDFLEWAKSGRRATSLGDKTEPWAVDDGRKEGNWLEALAKFNRKEEGIILYLSQPGGTDENDKPFLFDERGGKRDIGKLIKALKEIKKKKLLILDATQTPTDWRNGILVNRFAIGLQNLNEEIKLDPNLLVLCSSSEGQRSWVSEEFGRGIFAHFLMEGLSGGAINGGKGPITAVELLPYVRGKVDGWVQRNRADKDRSFRQEPFLLPRGAENENFAKNFTLAYGDPDYTAKAKLIPDPDQRAQSTGDDVQKAWKACDDLAAKTPGPWVYSPRGWRRFRELLLRYEFAVRAGDQASAGRLRNSIDKLADKLDKDRTVKAGEFLSAGLSMPAALGRDVPIADLELSKLMYKKDPLPDLKRLDPAGNETVPRLRFMGYMLKVAAEKPEEFAKIANYLADIDDGGASRPAEAHLAVMLARHTPLSGGAKPAPELLQLALTVRRLADEVMLSVGTADGRTVAGHPYSERLLLALAVDVSTADHDRRQGEDLLFAAVEPDHAEAEKLLRKAKSQYEQVRVKAAPARRACEVRDAVFADLPFLTEWAARDVAQLTDSQQNKVVELWKEAHALADRVAQLDPLNTSPPKTDSSDKDLNTLANDVWSEFTALAKIHQGFVKSLIDGPEATTQWFRQRIEYVLAAPAYRLGDQGPAFSAADRKKLVTRARAIGFTLAQNQTTPTGAAVTEDKKLTEDKLAVNVGRYAKALLGKTILDGLTDSNAALKRSSELANGPALGSQLAGHWATLRTVTDRATRSDTDKSVEPLHRRERLGILSGTSDDKQPREPSLDARDARWNLTFLRLANRAEVDHWYDGNAIPFSENIAKKFLKGLPDEDEKKELADITSFKVKGIFQVKATGGRTLTTERDIDSVFTIDAIDRRFDPGFATILPKMKSTVLEFKPPRTVKTIPMNKDHRDKVELHAPKALDSLDKPPAVDLELSGFYRGQTTTSAIAKFPIKPDPDLTINRPEPPKTALVAVSADNLAPGAIAIVFDCSGSMDLEFEDKITKSKRPKIEAAKDALRQFEDELPQGALVSLWVYSHIGRKKNIEQLVPLTRWEKSRKLLSETIKPLKCDAYTPLIEAMTLAAEDQAFKGAPGSKTLLVLTDGANRPEDKVPTKDDIVAFTKQFNNAFVEVDRKISVQMVLFALENDQEAADTVFKGIDKIVTPSKKNNADSLQDLSKLLKESLRPRVALYHEGKKVTNTEFIAKGPKESLDWFPKDPAIKEFGVYEMHCAGVEQKIVLNAGDRVAMRIYQSDQGIRLSRLLMADDIERSGLNVLDGSSKDAPFALGQDEKILYPGATTARAKVTLEDRAATRGNADKVRLDRPRWIWWEFKGMGRNDLPSGSVVTQLHDSPAPMWELFTNQWPSSGGDRVKPMVEAWATASDPDVAGTLELTPGGTLPNVPVDSNTATLESAGFELVKMPKNDRTAPEVECLVVRIRSSGKYYVQVSSPALAESHRYFNEAKSSTHAFLLREDAKSTTLRINLINVEAAKSKCKHLKGPLLD